MKTAQQHAARVAQHNADLRLMAAPRFHVVERATGKPVGDGTPMPYSFAVHVRDVLDAFRDGSFLLQAV